MPAGEALAPQVTPLNVSHPTTIVDRIQHPAIIIVNRSLLAPPVLALIISPAPAVCFTLSLGSLPFFPFIHRIMPVDPLDTFRIDVASQYAKLIYPNQSKAPVRIDIVLVVRPTLTRPCQRHAHYAEQSRHKQHRSHLAPPSYVDRFVKKHIKLLFLLDWLILSHLPFSCNPQSKAACRPCCQQYQLHCKLPAVYFLKG